MSPIRFWSPYPQDQGHPTKRLSTYITYCHESIGNYQRLSLSVVINVWLLESLPRPSTASSDRHTRLVPRFFIEDTNQLFLDHPFNLLRNMLRNPVLSSTLRSQAAAFTRPQQLSPLFRQRRLMSMQHAHAPSESYKFVTKHIPIEIYPLSESTPSM